MPPKQGKRNKTKIGLISRHGRRVQYKKKRKKDKWFHFRAATTPPPSLYSNYNRPPWPPPRTPPSFPRPQTEKIKNIETPAKIPSEYFGECIAFVRIQLVYLRLEASHLQWSFFLLQLTIFSFFTYNWSLFVYSFSFLTYSWSFFAYSGRVRLIRALRDCKQRSLTVSKEAPTVSKKASPNAFAPHGIVELSLHFSTLQPEIIVKLIPKTLFHVTEMRFSKKNSQNACPCHSLNHKRTRDM